MNDSEVPFRNLLRQDLGTRLACSATTLTQYGPENLFEESSAVPSLPYFPTTTFLKVAGRSTRRPERFHLRRIRETTGVAFH